MATAKPDYVELKHAFESAKTPSRNATEEDKKVSMLRYKESIRDYFKDKKVRENFSFIDLAHSCLSQHTVNTWRKSQEVNLERAYESDGVIGTDAFADISAQWMYANVFDAYSNEEDFPFTKIVGERKATNTKGEIVPCYTDVINPTTFRPEKGTFDDLYFADDWIKTPPTLDRGGILEWTQEVIYDDKVGDVANDTKKVGYRIGVDREIDCINAFLDENSAQTGGQVIPYPTGSKPWQHNWKQQGFINTYGSNSGSHTFDNLATGASTALVDWTTVNLAQQKFYALLNPYTSLPIDITPRHFIVPKTLLPTAQRITRATEVRMVTPGYATSANPVQTLGPTPLDVNYQIVSSRLLQQRMSNGVASTSNWYLGDLARLLQCMMVFPLEVVDAPPLNPEHFRRRIVKIVRFSTDYAYVVWQPRAMVKAQGT